MRIKKTLTAIALALSACLGLAGCSNDADVASQNISRAFEGGFPAPSGVRGGNSSSFLLFLNITPTIAQSP